MTSAHIPAPLLWELTRNNSAYTIKRKSGGGAQFSRDPLNLVNKHSRKHDGYINDQAIGVSHHEKGGVTLTTKKADKSHQPGNAHQTSNFGANTSSRKTNRTLVNSTANKGYRSDLRSAAVARSSAIKKSQKPVKERPASKPRGKKAQAAKET